MSYLESLKYGAVGSSALVFEHVFLSSSEIYLTPLVATGALFLVHVYRESDDRSFLHAFLSGIGLAPMVFSYGAVLYLLEKYRK